MQLSSANWDSSTSEFIRFMKSLTIRLNKIGLITLPWGVPFSSSCTVEVSCPILTLKLRSLRKLLIQLWSLPFITKLI